MKKGVAVLEVFVGEKAGRGVFRFLRDGCQVFVSDAVVVKPFAFGRYRLVPSYEKGGQIWFMVKRVECGMRSSDLWNLDCGFGIGYIGEGGNGRVFVGGGDEGGGEVAEVVEVAKSYELGYVVLGFGYVEGEGLMNRSVAVSELCHAMLSLPQCDFEVKQGEGVVYES
jgi:hypothetical protein